jgi:hypothetical protein
MQTDIRGAVPAGLSGNGVMEKIAVYGTDGKCVGLWAAVQEVPDGHWITHEPMTAEELAQHPDRNSDGTVREVSRRAAR